MKSFVFSVSLLLFFCSGIQLLAADTFLFSPSKAVVKILVVANPPSFHQPWQNLGKYSVNGSGFIIEGQRILTNAHVVSDAMFIQVRRAGKTEKYAAEVEFFDHESDLALLKVENAAFFKGSVPVDIGELPDIRDKVAVYGFPDGGEKISITEGVVSRIEHINYSYSGAFLLACQIDASINSGNSGGPVVMDNKVVGMAFQGMGLSYENIGYTIPAPVIKQFLLDCEDGKIQGIPDLGLLMQKLESPYLREYYRLDADENGALVNKVLPGSSATGYIEPEDVLLQIDGYDIAYDGTIEFREGQRTFFGYAFQNKQLGSSVHFLVKRSGNLLRIEVPLFASVGFDRLVPLVHEKKPRYFIFGGLVFQPLTENYLHEFGGGRSWLQQAPIELLHFFLNEELESLGEEIVIISEVLADQINTGYHDLGDNVVRNVNGKSVENFAQLVRLLDRGSSKFVVLEVESGLKIILRRKTMSQGTEKVIQGYSIHEDRRL
ncbi:MAG: trypsin [Deltaproteobacteria bacterium]|nr:MAG: trypsin [Deltaproteobacteria bacterium]